MKPECVQAITAAAGRALSKGEVDGIEERVHGAMKELARKDVAAWRTMTPAQRYTEAAKLAKTNMLSDMARQHEQVIRDATLKARELRTADSFKPGLKGQLAALRQRAIHDAADRGTGAASLEMQTKAVFHDFMRRLGGVADEGRFWGAMQDPVRQRELTKAIFSESADPETNKLGQQVRDVLDTAFQRMNDAGIHVHRLDNWHLPQPWAWEKIGANTEQFVQHALDAIDPAAYVNRDGSPMSAKEIEDTVRAAAETLATDGANKRAQSAPHGGSGNVGGNRNAPRQLHFRDADSYMRMMDNYGSANNVYSLLVHHLHGVARDVAAAERFGRDADKFFTQLVERTFANDAKAINDPKKLTKLDDLKKSTLMEWEAMRRPGGPGQLPAWAVVSKATRGVASATLLGSSTLAAVPDLAMATVYGRTIGLTVRQVLGNVMEGIKPTKENVANITRLGVVVHGLQDAANRFGMEELGNGSIRFLNHAVHVLSLLRMWDRGMAHGVSASFMDMIGGLTRKAGSLADLSEGDRKYLEGHGTTDDHWAVWKAAELDKGPNGNHAMLTPDAIYAVPDDALRPLAEQRLAAVSDAFAEARAKAKDKPDLAEAFDKRHGEAIAREIRNLRSDAATHLLATTLGETQIGARGGQGESVAEQVRLGLQSNPEGSLTGELLRWGLFLKRTPLGIFRTHMIDVPKRFDTWQSQWAYRAKFMAVSGMLGALSLELKNLANGGDPEDLTNPKTLGKVLIASGGLGMYGDFLFGDKGDHQNGTLAKLIGPGATMAEDALNVLFDSRTAAAQAVGIHEDGEPTIRGDQFSAKGVRFLHNYVAPGIRIWYLKAAFNHLVYQQLMDKLSPGYTDRVRQRMAERKQGSWWAPGGTMPERAPNLGAALSDSGG